MFSLVCLRLYFYLTKTQKYFKTNNLKNVKKTVDIPNN